MVFHRRREFSVANVESAKELAENLVNHSWCLCTGFRLGDLLFLNDATSEDGAVEFAVVEETTMEQVESITFGWMDAEAALGCIERFRDGERSEEVRRVYGKIQNRIEECEGHTCGLCA